MRAFKFSKNCLCIKIINLQKPKIFGIFVNHFLKHVNIFAQNKISFQTFNWSKCIGTVLNSLMTHVSLNFLSTNFFEAIFAMDFEVSQDLFQNKLNRLWNDLSVKEFVLLHSCHNFCSTFFLWKCWKMMISFNGFPIHTNTVRFWCKVWKFFELSDYCKNWFTSPPTVFAQWISLISKST